MAEIVDYKGLQITSPAPTGAGGAMIQNNTRTIADRLEGIISYLSSLLDVVVTGLADGHLLRYVSSTGKWTSGTPDSCGLVDISSSQTITGKKTFSNVSTGSNNPTVDITTSRTDRPIFRVWNSNTEDNPVGNIGLYWTNQMGGSMGASGPYTTTHTGAFISRGASASQVGLSAQGYVNHTSNLFQWMDWNSNVYGYIGRYGNIFAAVQNAAAIPLVLKGAPSQTADLQQWLKSDNTILGRVDIYGNFWVGDLMAQKNLVAYPTTNCHVIGGYAADVTSGSVLLVKNNGTTKANLVLKGIASQTANKLQATDNNGTIEFAVGPTGQFKTNQAVGPVSAVTTLQNAMPIYDVAGTLLGYIPIYQSYTAGS